LANLIFIYYIYNRLGTNDLFLNRFWLCRAVESWLRSSSQFGVADQLFVIQRGLLQHIVNVLLETESAAGIGESAQQQRLHNIAGGNTGPPREVAQSSFDLLGEMIRFNMEACRQLDCLLTSEAKVNFIQNLVEFPFLTLPFLCRFLNTLR